MLTLSAIVLTVTALGGLCLFALYQWTRPAGRVWLPGVAHGGLGLAGFVLLLIGLAGPPRGVATGSGQFGMIGAVMIGVGFMFGVLLAAARWRGGPPSAMVLGIHASIAVGGLVMLAAYLSAPAAG
jgi:hypothetical protein